MAAAAAKKPATPSLDQQVKDYFDTRKQNGHAGLVLLDQCIQRCAKHRDWDGLSRFIGLSVQSSSKSKVVKIVRAAFGNKLAWKANKKHDTGGQVAIMWEGAFPLSKSNTYSLVTAAIAKGQSWDDRDFLKELPGTDKPQRTVSAEAEAKTVKHLVKYLQEREAEGFALGAIMAAVQKELVAGKATASKPIAAPVKGADGVIEVPH